MHVSRAVPMLLALAVVVAACEQSDPTGPLQAPDALSAKAPDGLAYNPANGSYYLAVAAPGIAWGDAADAAAELRYRSCEARLATITSQEENDFITTTFPDAADGSYWLGGVQVPGFGEPAGGWGWITGEPFSFANWATGEPNDARPCPTCDENRVHFAGFAGLPTYWNDEWQQNVGGLASGYVVEYDCGPRGPVVARVSGSGHFTHLGELRTFSFTARRYADGTVRGEWQQNNRALEAKEHGDVTCFAVEGSQAWIGGVAERGDAVGEVGWTVVDNDQGAAPPDQISLKFISRPIGFASAYCTATPMLGEPFGLDLFHVEAGNIQLGP